MPRFLGTKAPYLVANLWYCRTCHRKHKKGFRHNRRKKPAKRSGFVNNYGSTGRAFNKNAGKQVRQRFG